MRKKAKQEIEIDNNSFFSTLCGKLGNNSTVPLNEHNPALFSLLPTSSTPPESDINVVNVEEVVTSEDNKPSVYKYIYLNTDDHRSSDDFFEFVKNMPHQNIYEIERHTDGQYKNPKWKQCRKMRITSSDFHEVVNRLPTTTSDRLSKKFIQRHDEDINTPSLSWGKKHEPIAKKKFIALQRRENKNVQIKEVGLVLCANHGYLGASPDGILHIVDRNTGVKNVRV